MTTPEQRAREILELADGLDRASRVAWQMALEEEFPARRLFNAQWSGRLSRAADELRNPTPPHTGS